MLLKSVAGLYISPSDVVSSGKYGLDSGTFDPNGGGFNVAEDGGTEGTELRVSEEDGVGIGCDAELVPGGREGAVPVSPYTHVSVRNSHKQ